MNEESEVAPLHSGLPFQWPTWSHAWQFVRSFKSWTNGGSKGTALSVASAPHSLSFATPVAFATTELVLALPHALSLAFQIAHLSKKKATCESRL